MRLVFLAALAKTLHEVTIGLDLAEQLADAGVESHFVVNPYNEEQLRAARLPHTLVEPELGADVRQVVHRVVKEFRADAVVLVDYLAHWMTFKVGYRTDPWFVEDLGLPVIPLDLYDLENTSRRVEILGTTMEVDDNLTRMPVQLLPVPMNRPQVTASGRGLPYRANRTLAPLTAAARRETRACLGLPGGARLLMVPTLPWQQLMQVHAAPPTRELAARLPRLLAGYLGRLPRDTHFLMTGPLFEGFAELLPADRVHHRPACTAAEYHRLLAAGDAVFAFHLPGYALERAVLADVPGLLAVNNHPVDGPRDADRLGGAFAGGTTDRVRDWLADYPGPLPDFHMWPLRWNEVLRPLLEANPFTETLLRAEILDENALVAGLERVLYDEAERDRLAAARAAYRDAVHALPDTAHTFTEAAHRLGLG
ncbi:DUF6365 family protein [Streptomyces sp. SID10815]|uniref:Glycosyltransferase n=1 Tax=Streptomyces similanensis TaxID=1274988 RepID=A0ABP9LE91_9ACTN|nr:DUF6365 family protein [Streptomyces sp. SID10815]NEA45453.1 hypothetical protein [Streptomyces sp. SID10815]